MNMADVIEPGYAGLVRKRIEKLGDLWKPLLDKRKRFDLKPYLK